MDGRQAADNQEAGERSRAPSPSALSTASSSSPLVRNNSATSSSSSGSGRGQRQAGRRAALPTSIAAAQLQSNQLEFVNKAHQGAAERGKKLQSGLAAKLAPLTSPDWTSPAAANNAPPVGGKRLPGDDQKGGHCVAKSVALGVSKFGEFWSVNKMRYMNLACLLMTLVCLVTILLFSHSTERLQPSKAATVGPSPLSPFAPKHRRGDQFAAEAPPADNLAVESMDSLDKLALARDKTSNDEARGASASADQGKPISDFGMFDDDDSNAADAADPKSKDDPADVEQESPSPGASSVRAGSRPRSFLEPILSQVFDDLNSGLGALVARSARNGTARSALAPPIIRRSKNGATIIISGTTAAGGSILGDLLGANKQEANSTAAGSSANSTTGNTLTALPTLLERLLPPMLRPLSVLDDTSGSATTMRLPNGFATITINSRPIVTNLSDDGPAPLFERAAGDSPLAFISSSSPFESPFSPAASSMSPSHHLFRGPSSLVMPMPMSMSPFWAPPPALARPLFPPPSLLRMLLRAAANSDDKISAQASQRMNQTATAALNSTAASTNSSTTTDTDEQDEVELFNVGQYRRARPALGSMLVISSSSAFPSPAAQGGADLFPVGSSLLPFSPLGHQRRHAADLFNLDDSAQMFASGRDGDFLAPPLPFGHHGAMSPLLRGLFGNFMSELSSGGGEPSSRFRDNSRGPTRSSSARMWPPGERVELRAPRLRHELNQDTAADNQKSGVSRGAQLAEASQVSPSFDAQPAASSGFASDEPMDEQPKGGGVISALPSPPGFVSGTIRQTFRRPGLSFERVIELPASSSLRPQSAQAQQQLERNPLDGIRSQSISRIDEQQEFPAGNIQAGHRHFTASSPLIGRHQMLFGGSESALESRAGGEPGEPLPPFGLIGRLLDDLRGPPMLGRSGGGFVVSPAGSTKRFDLDPDDLDEGDQLNSDEFARPPSDSWPAKIRVASARVRVKNPTFNSQGRPADSLGLFAPPARFSFPALDATSGQDEQEEREETSQSSGETREREPAKQEPPSGAILDDLNNAIVKARGEVQSLFATSRDDEARQQAGETRQSAHRPESAFTSPNSPLFGFPLMAASQLQHVGKPAENNVNGDEPVGAFARKDRKETSSIDQAESSSPAREAVASAPASSPAAQNHRRQRAFVYHSNHEVAASLQPAAARIRGRSNNDHQPQADRQTSINDEQHSQHQAAAAGEHAGGPQFALPPPAAIVMGRRLDDGPFAMDQPQEET